MEANTRKGRRVDLVSEGILILSSFGRISYSPIGLAESIPL